MQLYKRYHNAIEQKCDQVLSKQIMAPCEIKPLIDELNKRKERLSNILSKMTRPPEPTLRFFFKRKASRQEIKYRQIEETLLMMRLKSSQLNIKHAKIALSEYALRHHVPQNNTLH